MNYAKIFILLMIILIIGCSQQKETQLEAGSMKLTSFAFENGRYIPIRHTCDGDNVPPHLIIKDVPEGTASLALIMDDPDAPGRTFVHWVAWNIPPDKKEILEDEDLEYQGMNDFGKREYGGPCPPSGTHRYFFKLYALDTELNLSESATKKDLEHAIKGHILAETSLMGLYKR